MSLRHGHCLPSISLSTLALLLYSAGSSAECLRPELPKTLSAPHSSAEAFQSRVYEFIVCQRNSLEKRATGLAPGAVRQLILKDRAAEDRALAELESVEQCFNVSKRASDPTTARTKCESAIESALKDRRPDKLPQHTELASEHRNAYGGVWSYRTLYFGRPGNCMDGPCDHMFGVEVTNMTLTTLTCAVALKVSTQEEGGARQGEQAITVMPGDSLPTARVTTHYAAAGINAVVTCSPATPHPAPLRVPAECAVNWIPRPLDFPKGLTRSYWESGAALIEFAGPETYGPPKALRVVHADSPRIGEGAEAQMKQLRLSTNCPRQRFRVRVEFRAFPCHPCGFSPGVVTLYRMD